MPQPVHTSDVDAALAKARHHLANHYGSRLHHVVLFGSQARGDTHEDSDVDVLVVLEDPVNPWAEVKPLTDLHLQLLDRFGVYVQFVPFARSRYQDHDEPLMQNVHREGLLL